MKKIFPLFGLLVCLCSALRAQPAGNIYVHKVGIFDVILLSEGQQQGKTEILIGATNEMLEETVPSGTFPNAVNAFLLKAADANILVDTGFGRELFSNLSSVGIEPEQITAVLLTHMHGDHIGGLLRDGEVAFPNADLYIALPEYEYWSEPEQIARVTKVLEAYQEKIHLFTPCTSQERLSEILPGITPIATPGHTPGHTAYLVRSGDSSLLIWGDLTHALAIQMPYPQVAVTYDVAPRQAAETRLKVLESVANHKVPVAGMHIAYPGIGKVEELLKGGYRFTPFK